MIHPKKAKYKVIGLMSGTSLDGLDIAYCVFEKLKSGWRYSIDRCHTIRYPTSWYNKLKVAHTLQGEALMALDADFGTYIGKITRNFLDKHALKADFIASHGHTIFHQPAKGFTTQIGNGYALYVASGLPVVYDFRTQDVALGGEGAPLVPAGDKFLFQEYDVCLNLGGIANLSVDVKSKRYAFDICFCNMGLNHLASEIAKPFDKNGEMAAAGTIHNGLLKKLNKIYAKLRVKRPSLGREIFEHQIAELLEDKSISLHDRLCTFTEAAAIGICEAIFSRKTEAKVLCTGGGTFNSFLVARMLHHGGDELTFIIPEEEVIKFKEAMVFAFLGVLRVRYEINCLKTVTGASRDSSSGTLIGF